MSSSKDDPFTSIATTDLEKVSGGAARVAASSDTSSVDDQLMAMLQQIGTSIQGLAQNNNGGMDPMTMMMMMMMMGGGGGGGGAYAAPPVQPPTYVAVTTGNGSGGGGGCGGRGC